MKKLQIIILIIAALSLSGCARGCQNFKRSTSGNHARSVKVTLYSGGEAVKTWEFKGIINNDAQSIFFYDNQGKLVEIDGDVLIEYLD